MNKGKRFATIFGLLRSLEMKTIDKLRVICYNVVPKERPQFPFILHIISIGKFFGRDSFFKSV